MRLTDHLIVISFDCLSSLDFQMLEQLPNFKELLRNGSYCKQVETIYPSVTYPCHTSIITGKFPNRHGVVNNTFLQPGAISPDWYWHRKHIKGTTLYDEAKKAGLRTAALLWPVTAKANIDYNMPEIFANRNWHHQVAVSLSNGSLRYQLDMNRKFGKTRKGLQQPELDDFVLASTVETIIKKQPNLLLVHFTDLDTKRHYHGFSSKEAIQAIHRHDQRLGEIIGALKQAGMYEKSTIVALGDHSALDESSVIKPNILLREKGLLTIDDQERITDWKAYCKSCDGSAYVYVKDPTDAETKRIVHEIFKGIQGESGIESILTGMEAALKGADGSAFLMLEAKQGYYFKEYATGTYIEEISPDDVQAGRYTYASHGYSPDKKDYTTIFMATGRGIKPHINLNSMHLVDEGPTFAKLLGVDLGATDGRIVEELLNL
ncbi:ectonucleotide pyrophosphatase/phosphodiesterase [Aquibacillus koreensis]|uniref:Ectonucleotide pyrophosphatase/phosphodiesterase n=1 Tax=Aquibacillus koreensis TaxID=279446 RepID=A0A9X3WJZ6_9BACI|nr:ectonucleotide pyrophosphatase/phosphodiesterase [Aquibacillus koreensis]MCT2537810.1 ectonucleotide pyrophosphatase/phosphodiesterase [Aquibacillus koreensis]MDC3421157.1 ectonucleotide pyrophosphatase/phosphodiesterase [Aquibacillus koreensis]